MNFLRAGGAAVYVATALLLVACGGGNNATTTTTTATATNKPSTGTRVKQLNGLHKMHNAMSGHLLNINMGAMNGSKQDGAASVGDKGKGVEVSIHLYNEPKGASEPAHIHMGTCQKLNPAPWKPLSNVVNGTSNTFLAGVTVAQIKKGTYAINAHKSASDLKTYVSCGNLKP